MEPRKEAISSGDHKLVDVVRGSGQVIESNTTDVEGNESNNFTGFNDDGFDLSGNNAGAWNENSHGYVAWCWKAGGAAVANTNGSITSQVSANQTAGFSIVTWLSNAAGNIETMGHGLGKSPDFMIVKNRDYSYDTWVWHKDLSNTTRGYLRLNTTASEQTGGNDTWSTSSTTFGLRQSSMANANTDDFVAYCWAEIEGFSKFGSYTGNGSTDGPFIYCGFKPAWVMYKRTDTTGNWAICDSSRNPTNPLTFRLFADRSDEDTTGVDPFDFVSTWIQV